MSEKFNYVIARKWDSKSIDNSLCCYTYHSTVFYGDTEDAQKTLEFIRGKIEANDEEKNKDYQIYRINDEPIRI